MNQEINNVLMRPILLLALLLAPSRLAMAQVSGHGVQSRADIRPIALRDPDLIRLYNGVEVLGEKFVGTPAARVRVIGTWGGPAKLACDCILTKLHIAVNQDGDELRAYSLPELLDPAVISIVTEKKNGVVYIDYGPETARQRIRVEILSTTIRVTDGTHR